MAHNTALLIAANKPIMQSVIMLNVIMLNVVMLSVVAPIITSRNQLKSNIIKARLF